MAILQGYFTGIPRWFRGWMVREVPVVRPIRKIDPFRILLHVLYWSYNLVSVYDTYVSIFTSRATGKIDWTVFYLALIDNQLVTVSAYYVVSAFVLPSLLNHLVFMRATNRIVPTYWGKIGLVLLAGFFLMGVNDYYLMVVIHKLAFEPVLYAEHWYKKFQPYGIWAIFRSYSVFQFVFAFSFYYVLVPVMLKTIRETIGWGHHAYNQGIERQALIKDKLDRLHYQINPHFLFNAFASLHALINKTNSEGAKFLRQLSEIFNYTLYEAKDYQVSLSKEVEFLTNYINLEKVRRFDPERIEFTVEGDTHLFSIPPITLITFVENAFKHGLRGEGGYVRIRLETRAAENQLTFQIENSVTPPPVTGSFLQQTGDPIGLKNVKERLRTLYAPNQYTLSIDSQATLFRVRLDLFTKAPSYHQLVD